MYGVILITFSYTFSIQSYLVGSLVLLRYSVVTSELVPYRGTSSTVSCTVLVLKYPAKLCMVRYGTVNCTVRTARNT